MASNGLTGAIYAGGQKVDYVVVAVAESAPLMLRSGAVARTAARAARSARLGLCCGPPCSANRWPPTTLSLIGTHRRANGYRITRYG